MIFKVDIHSLMLMATDPHSPHLVRNDVTGQLGENLNESIHGMSHLIDILNRVDPPGVVHRKPEHSSQAQKSYT